MKTLPWGKGIIAWPYNGSLYLSVPFTWLLKEAERLAGLYEGPVYIGGPGAMLQPGIDFATLLPETHADVLSMHNPDATFTSRGCPRRCPYCAVPIIEGRFKELRTWKVAPLVCDNNILASSQRHFERVIDSLRDLPYVDFNQGLDARFFSDWHAGQIARLNHAKVRFAFDSLGVEKHIIGAIERSRRAGLRDIGAYVLIGWKDNLENALYRLETLRSCGIRPNPMRYQPLDTTKKNSYVDPGWTDYDLKRVTRYYSRLRYTAHIPFEDFRNEYRRRGG